MLRQKSGIIHQRGMLLKLFFERRISIEKIIEVSNVTSRDIFAAFLESPFAIHKSSWIFPRVADTRIGGKKCPQLRMRGDISGVLEQ